MQSWNVSNATVRLSKRGRKLLVGDYEQLKGQLREPEKMYVCYDTPADGPHGFNVGLDDTESAFAELTHFISKETGKIHGWYGVTDDAFAKLFDQKEF